MNTAIASKNKWKTTLFLCAFLFIPVVMSFMFVVYPVLSLVQLSFVEWNGIAEKKKFVGAYNYISVLTRSPEVWISLKNNALYFIGHGILIPLQLAVAAVLNAKFLKGRNFFKTTTFLPYIINGVAIAYTFSYFFTPMNGALNGILKALQMDFLIQRWLSDPQIVNFTLVFVSMWKYFGFGVIIYIAALKSIPGEIIEAAEIDGANAFQVFFSIYMPSVRRITEILIFLNIRGALTIFDIPYVMTGGGPAHASSTFTVLTMETAFNFHNYGLASSMGIVLMIIIIVVNFLQQKIFADKEGI